MKTWIVAANAGGAKFFSQASRRELPEEIGEMPHPEGRLHEVDLQTDVHGFAREVSAYLRKAYDEKRFGELVLTASPEFLALLRKVLDPHVLAAARVQIHKDYTKFKPKELQAQVEAHRLPDR